MRANGSFCTESLPYPELRGQPIAIVPIRIKAQTGGSIAVSYQAKAYSVKTGFSVADVPSCSARISSWGSKPKPPIFPPRQTFRFTMLGRA
jgi:nucleotidyltransferase/DNA polymerase involved in DNA repair